MAESSKADGEHQGCTYRVSQQQMKALHPVLSSRFAFWLFLFVGVIFTVVGGVFIHYSLQVFECQRRYPTFDPDSATVCDAADCYSRLELTMDVDDCIGLSKEAKDTGILEGPVFVYYSITNFFQNHRRYVMSRSAAQLTGQILYNKDEVSSCTPMELSDDGRIMQPCGLIAWSVFNDTFAARDAKGNTISLDESAKAINFSVDTQYYRNPSAADQAAAKDKVDFWLNETIFPGQVENPHFINWMRLAQTADFRKLYARVDDAPPLPWTFTILNRYPLAGPRSHKAILISRSNFMGGRNIFLGTLYVTTGIVCFVFSVVFCVTLKKNPRTYGDVRYMLQSKQK